MKSVLTICIGNICRSPMAQAVIANAVPSITVTSAGIAALVGQPADAEARSLMLERGIDISSHYARQLNSKICQAADLVLVMDLEQKRFIETNFPLSRGKVFRIAEPLGEDIADPYRRGPKAFKNALSLIDEGAQIWIQRINKIMKEEREVS